MSPILNSHTDSRRGWGSESEILRQLCLCAIVCNGNMYTIAGADYNEMTNPGWLLFFHCCGSHGWSHKFVTDFIGELQIWDGLKYRISYSTDLSFWGSESHQIKYYMTDANKSTRTSATSESDRGTVWQLENTLTLWQTFGNHTINVVLGQSAFRNTGWTLGAQVYNLSDLTKPLYEQCNRTCREWWQKWLGWSNK